jgi:uncharacterized flavoprotein (TIGR03862 family)
MTAVAVVGAGPAGLIAAERLAEAGHVVTVFDAMPSPARKFLLAGRGGLNITHSEPFQPFLARYREAEPRLRPLIAAFDSDAMRAWCAELGEEAFVGSSGRVFPRSFKASPLLRAWLRRLAARGVALRTGYRLVGIGAGASLRFAHGEGETTIAPDAAVLALGGASWPRLGSTGAWVPLLSDAGIAVSPLLPSNVGLDIGWSDITESRHAGEPLKRIALTFEGETARGEAMITVKGLEGGAVYALSAPVREALRLSGSATMALDLRPDIGASELGASLAKTRRGDSLTNRLRKAAGLAPQAIAVLRDCVPGIADHDPAALAAAIKAVPLRVTGLRPIERAISSAGGVRWSELDDGLMLVRRPGMFCAGEMIDWEAPTGGYLLQACFATGIAAAAGLDRWVRTRPTSAAEG